MATFEPAVAFAGARPGKVFKLGNQGLGYYHDAIQAAADAESQQTAGAETNSALEKLRKHLPQSWANCTSLREEYLKVDPKLGCGLDLEASDFGFSVAGVQAKPGQSLKAGDVVVAIEYRLLAGLSAPQMQASFVKRRQDGAKMQVATLEEVQYLSTLDPNVVECWDNQHQRYYYFNKKDARSGWTREEVSSSVGTASSSSKEKKAAAPIDLASFLSHGFSQQKGVPAPKKRKKADASSGGKDESDLARQEKQRWDAWNAGGQGGYTEQFFEKYKNCQSNPPKPKPDKRLQGSVGPGQGMEYMARWTGSQNSFN